MRDYADRIPLREVPMSDRTPLPIPEHVVAKARQIWLALQPYVEDLCVKALVGTYREGFADGYLANPANLDEETTHD